MKLLLVGMAIIIAGAIAADVIPTSSHASLRHPIGNFYPLNFEGLVKPTVSTNKATFRPGTVASLQVSVHNNSTDNLWDPNFQLYLHHGFLVPTNVVSWKPAVIHAKYDGFNNRTAWLTGSLLAGKQKIWTVKAKVPKHLSSSARTFCFHLTLQLSSWNGVENTFDYTKVCRPIAGR